MKERRRAPRIHLHTELHAKVKSYLDARVIEFSETGALLEVDHALPPRGICDLRLALDSAVLQIHAAVRRCSVVGHPTTTDGNRALTYHAALEFRECDREMALQFAHHLEHEPSGEEAVEFSEWK